MGGKPPAALKPFRVSHEYIEWAHSSAAEENQPLAVRVCGTPTKGREHVDMYHLVDEAVLVAEIADVAELYRGGQDNDLRAAGVYRRALAWLKARGLTLKEAKRLESPTSPV